jgi:hypothetical protein
VRGLTCEKSALGLRLPAIQAPLEKAKAQKAVASTGSSLASSKYELS